MSDTSAESSALGPAQGLWGGTTCLILMIILAGGWRGGGAIPADEEKSL